MSWRVFSVGLCLCSLVICRQAWGSGSPENGSWLPPSNHIIFHVGKRDNSHTDLAHSGFTGVLNYQVYARNPIKSPQFPEGMFYSSDNKDPDTAFEDMDVPKITIHFTLKRLRRDVVFRVARAGSETSIVNLDGKKTFRITSAMLGSNEGWVVGHCDLHIGPVAKGNHTLVLTVDPHDGNSPMKTFGWDALVLFWR